MRALVLISGLATGGAERVVVSLLRRLAAEDGEVAACTVTARHDGPLAAELVAGGVRRFDLGAKRLADPKALARLVRLLRTERIEVIHAHGQDASILAAAARSASSVRLAVTRHVLDEPAVGWRQVMRAHCALHAFRRAHAAVAVSGAAADRLAQLTRLPRRAVHVIPNGIDVNTIAGLAVHGCRAAVVSALGIDPTERLVLVPAVLRAGKGHDVLLSTLPLLRLLVPDVRILFAGSGEEETRLRCRAQVHGNTVLFLGDRADIPELLGACDVVVLPSFSEALPTALMEAAAAARPVVATNVGGTPEVVVHGRTGLLVPPGDGSALVNALAELLLDPARARAMGEEGQRLARQRFTIERHAHDTTALWAELVKGGGR